MSIRQSLSRQPHTGELTVGSTHYHSILSLSDSLCLDSHTLGLLLLWVERKTRHTLSVNRTVFV